MIVDSSALIAILTNEEDAKLFAAILASSKMCLVPAPIYLETCMVFCGRRNTDSMIEVAQLFRTVQIQICAFDQATAEVAVEAFLKYGKGRGHPAQLNFGDCISYAASKVEAMPLLFKGGDFRMTDVDAAL